MKILIADDHPIYAEGLKTLLGSRDYTDVTVVSDGRSAVTAALSEKPDIVFMDIKMPGLSGKQREIVALLSEGFTYKEIGFKLFLAERTVKYHIEHIKKKIGAISQAQLIAYFRPRGPIRKPE